MVLDPLSALFDLGRSAIDKIWPDPIKRAEEIRKLEELKQAGDLAQMQMHVDLMLAQLKVNAAEAQHRSIFVAGWRPFIGWIGGVSLAYAGVLHPILMWLWSLLIATGQIPFDANPPNDIESGILGTIVTGMLGIGTMRSFEKSKGVHIDSIKNKP
jgi:hypothetical protein